MRDERRRGDRGVDESRVLTCLFFLLSLILRDRPLHPPSPPSARPFSSSALCGDLYHASLSLLLYELRAFNHRLTFLAGLLSILIIAHGYYHSPTSIGTPAPPSESHTIHAHTLLVLPLVLFPHSRISRAQRGALRPALYQVSRQRLTQAEILSAKEAPLRNHLQKDLVECTSTSTFTPCARSALLDLVLI